MRLNTAVQRDAVTVVWLAPAFTIARTPRTLWVWVVARVADKRELSTSRLLGMALLLFKNTVHGTAPSPMPASQVVVSLPPRWLAILAVLAVLAVLAA